MKLKIAELILLLCAIHGTYGFLLDSSTTSSTGQCSDSDSLDCPTVNLTTNLCANVQIAIPMCPKFCGYCNVTNGAWTDWTPWSLCDVTCANGTHTRTRTCTNPPPTKPYGKDCVGSGQEAQPCYNAIQCPIHGEWGLWSPWFSCSQTCGMGMQRRDRHCDSPYPSLNGDHCFGEPISYRICSERACADGGWSPWGQWNTCSVSCGDGFRTRDRLCDSPAPSMLGKPCRGNPQMVSHCSNGPCQDIKSAFSVSHPHAITSGRLTFSTTIYNYGGDYSLSTGIFTCSKPGVYYFSVSLTKKRADSRVDRVYCDLYKNTGNVIKLYIDPTDDDSDKGSASVSNSAVQHLNRGDTVSLHGCRPPSDMEPWSSFSGFLLNADP